VSLDLGAGCMNERHPAVACRGLLNHGEVRAYGRAVPVLLRQPAFAFVRMSSPCPIPQVAVNLAVQCGEGGFRGYVPVIVAPALNNRVQGADHVTGFHGREFPDRLSDSGQDGSIVAPGRFSEELPAILARVLPQKVESVFYPRYPGFLRGEGETSFLKKLFYCRLDRTFEKLFRFPGDDEVVGVADDVDLGSVGGDGFYCRFQTVQCHVGQKRGDDPPLRGSSLGRIRVCLRRSTLLSATAGA